MIHEIELSNGAVYEIDAPEGTSRERLMEALSGNLDPADRNVLKTKNDDFGEFLRSQALEPIEGEDPETRRKRLVGDIPLPDVGAGEGSLRSGFQGATFGAGDELIGVMAAGLGRNPRNQSFGEMYDAFVARERDKLQSFRASDPALALGSEIAGAIPTALIAPGGAATGSLGRRSLAGAGVGGGLGAVYGFNAGEGGLANRLVSGAVTGTAGAGIGAVAPAAAEGAKALFNRTLGASRAARQAGVSRPAFDALSDIVEADRPKGRLPPQALVAERGPTAQAAADFLGQRPGPSQQIIRDAVGDRVAGATSRVTSALDDTLGAPQGIRQTAKGIAQTTSAVRREAYEAAYAVPIDYAKPKGQAIERVLTRVSPKTVEKAVNSANDIMRDEGLVNLQITANLADDGTMSFVNRLNVRQLDALKQGLNEVAETFTDDFGRPLGEGLRVGRQASALRDAIVNAVPQYGEALRLGGDKIARDNGLRLGGRLLSARTTREDVTEFTGRFLNRQVPADVRDAIQTGIRANIDDAMANVKRTMMDPNVDAREAAKAIRDLSSRANRRKLALVLGDDAAGRLLGEIDDAATAFNLQAATIQNSKTAVREMFNERLGPRTGPVNAALQGKPVEAAQTLTQALTGQLPADVARTTDAQAAELARALTQRGAQGQNLVSTVQRGPALANEAEHTRFLVEQLLRRNAPVTGPVTTRAQDTLR